MALSTIMGTSYACLSALRNLENVAKRMGADLLFNFLEPRQGVVRRIYPLGTSVNKDKRKGRSCYIPVLLEQRPEDGGWKLVHRHEDPISTPQL
jgi:hypothetical protein